MTHDFIHIGDLHLDERSPRNADRLHALDQIVAECLDRPNLAAWLLPGDFVRGLQAPLTIGDRNALDGRLMRMADRAPVVTTYGNHDAPGDLDGFANLRASYPIFVIDRPHVLSVRLATGAMASIACLPYPRRGGLIAAGTTAADTFDAGREALAAVVRGLALELHEARARGEITLSVGHLNVGGALASTGQPQIGREVELDPASVQALVEHGYVGLNHIHAPQAIHGAYYAGSVAPMDFGEREQKRFLVVRYRKPDTLDEAIKVGWVWDIESHALRVPAMYHLEGELTRTGFRWWEPGIAEDEYDRMGPRWTLRAALFANSDVRVKFTYLPAEKDVLDFALVKAPFAGARTLKLVPVPILDQAIRAPAVIAATTVVDQVRAYCAEQGIAVTDGLLAKLDTLQAPEAEDAALTRALPLEVTL